MKFENILHTANRRESFCIPREMVITGSVRADTSGHITGTINGDVWTKHKITIYKEGVVNGDITAEELVVYGKITGDVRKCKKMVVHAGAIIKGNIVTAEIHTEKDSRIDGIITTTDVPPVAIITNHAEEEEKDTAPVEEPAPSPADKNEPVLSQSWF